MVRVETSGRWNSPYGTTVGPAVSVLSATPSSLQSRSSVSGHICRLRPWSPSGLHQRVIEREHDRRRPVPQVELGEDVADVALHRAFTDEQLLGDLGVARPPPDQTEDVDFARRQLLELRALLRAGDARRAVG